MKIITPNWPAPANITAFTTLRSTFTRQQSNHALDNQALSSLAPLPSDPIWITQVHSNRAVEATISNLDEPADATFTRNANHVCVVLTADCLPILVCDQDGTQVAAIHAGWRGLASGVIENTLHSMQKPLQNLFVWLGPAIGPKRFEVGQDVFSAFTQHNPDAAKAFIQTSADKWLANLYLLATQRLNAMGVTKIYGGEFCTYSQDSLFFSYRRDKGNTGRMASLIWIKK